MPLELAKPLHKIVTDSIQLYFYSYLNCIGLKRRILATVVELLFLILLPRWVSGSLYCPHFYINIVTLDSPLDWIEFNWSVAIKECLNGVWRISYEGLKKERRSNYIHDIAVVNLSVCTRCFRQIHICIQNECSYERTG